MMLFKILLALFLVAPLPASASRLDDLRNQRQKKLEEAAQKKKAAQAEDKVKKEYDRQRAVIDAQKAATEQALAKTNTQIQQTNQLISSVSNQIQVLQLDIATTEGRLRGTASELYMFSRSSQGLLGIILGSQNFTEAVRQAEAFDAVRADFESEREHLVASKQAAEDKRKQLIVLNQKLAVAKRQKEYQEQALANQSAIKDRLAKDAAAESKRLNTEAEQALRTANSIESEIAQEIAKLVADRKKNPNVTLSGSGARVGQAVEAGQVIGNIGTTGYTTGPHVHFSVFVNGEHQNPRDYIPGKLTWPVEDFEFSQGYGPTSITGFVNPVYSFHNGVDLAAPYGTSVHTAAAGKIILDQRYGGYGNAVVIDHGDGLFTLYGHLI